MLKDGTLVIADEQLRTAVQYALERSGNNPEPQKKHRRTCLDGMQQDEERYDGFFAARVSEDQQFIEIYNGIYPEADYCGWCYFGTTTISVPNTRIPIADNDSLVYIYLDAQWSKESGYELKIHDGKNSNIFTGEVHTVRAYTIAAYRIVDKKIHSLTQLYKDGGAIDFSERYIV